MTMLRRSVSRRLATLAAACGALASTTLAQGTYLASDDLLVVQYESIADTSGDWNESTATPGFTDESYVRWDGPDLFQQPGAQGVFSVQFEVPVGGIWFMNLRNRHENADPTEENDVWMKMGDEEWIKVFSNGPGSVGAWTWESRFDDVPGQPQASYNLSAGLHTLSFSGRSFGFKIDKFHLYRAGAIGATDPSLPESPQRFGMSYCSANVNSAGNVSSITAIGSPTAADNNLTLTVNGLPQNEFGIFIVSNQEDFIPNLSGTAANLCLQSPGRYNQILNSGLSGAVSTTVNLTNIPTPTGSAAAFAGQTWRWQYWHRDGASANTSRGIRVPFN